MSSRLPLRFSGSWIRALRSYSAGNAPRRQLLSSRIVKSLCFVSGGYLGLFITRKTLLCTVDEQQINPSQNNILEADGPSKVLSTLTFLETVVIALRLSYLFILFSPAVLLHLTTYIIDSHSLNRLKWSYVKFALQQAGPAFVKLGQWISTRRDVFQPDVCDTLCHLQKDCYTHSWHHTETILELELGEDWKDYFDEIDPIPIGSGCVAQVYKWVLSDKGMRKTEQKRKQKMKVAVKVLHPGVQGSISRDLNVMKYIASLMDRLYPNFYWISLKECVEDFSTVMEKQVNMEIEARNMEKFKNNFRSHPWIVFPTVLRPFVKQSILVESFEEGKHIGTFVGEDCSSVHKSLATVGIETLLSMLFLHNFVHCDLHPGNILVRLPVDPDDMPTLVILDCGVATSLSKRDWSIFFDLFTSIIVGDSRKVAELMLDNAEFSDCPDVEEYHEDMDRLITDAVQQLNLQAVNVGGLLANLFEVLIKNMIKLESNFTSVMLAVMVIEGLGRSLDPEMDILEAAKPFLLNTVKHKIMMHFD